MKMIFSRLSYGIISCGALTGVQFNDDCPDQSLNEICRNRCAGDALTCVENCDTTDTSCISSCLRGEGDCNEECPCESKCVNGCSGCDNDVCPSGKSVLVLSTANDKNEPFVVDFEGNARSVNFDFATHTGAYAGCSAVLNGGLLVFGGYPEQHQVSKVVGCSLKRVGVLPFNFYYGSCNTFAFPEEKVLLCFDLNHSQSCHTFDGENYANVASTRYSHVQTLGLAKYQGQPLTTGAYHERSVKTEIMNLRTGQWEDGSDYPFQEFISHYSTTSTSSTAYIIGGFLSPNIIAQYKHGQWFKVGDLSTGRYGHGSITDGVQTIIIGGNVSGTNAETEIWTLENSESLENSNPILPGGKYRYGTALFLVDSDFCL